MAKKKRRTVSKTEAPLESPSCDVTRPRPIEHSHKAPNSIELSRNAKGQASWSIKLYGERAEMASSVVDELIAIDSDLRLRTQIQDG